MADIAYEKDGKVVILESVNTPDYIDKAEVLNVKVPGKKFQPDLRSIGRNVPEKYRIIDENGVREMTDNEKQIVDQRELQEKIEDIRQQVQRQYENSEQVKNFIKEHFDDADIENLASWGYRPARLVKLARALQSASTAQEKVEAVANYLQNEIVIEEIV